MKFTDGRHQMAKDISFFNFKEVYETEISGRSLYLRCPSIHISRISQAFNEFVGEIEISSPMADMISIKIIHLKGNMNMKPEFELSRGTNVEVEIEDHEEYAVFKSGKLSLKIQKVPLAIDFFDGDRKITGCDHKVAGCIKTTSGKTYIVGQLNLNVDEYVYGFGEKFTPFVKNGQTVDIWNEDGGTDSWYAYKSIPFYLTNKGYGLLVNHSGRVSFEVGTETTSKIQFSVPGEQLEYFFIYGLEPKEIIKKYTALSGRPAYMPAWSLGLYLSTSFCTWYDEKVATEMLDRMKAEGIPISIFYFCCYWMREFHWCDFIWNSKRFPDPAGMLQRLKQKGVHICVWINPYISQYSFLFEEGVKLGYFLKKANGDVWQWDIWQPGMAIVDFTNPEACKWYKLKIQELLKMGVDSFKTDFGEQIPMDAVYFDGSDPEKMHNFYPYLYNKAVFEAIQEIKGDDEALLYARAATVGGQKFPIHWGGDCSTDYVSMSESLRAGLSLCLSGFGFWSHDIGGFVGEPTPDLYKRWVAFGLLSSHSRFHGANSYRVPWAHGEEATDVLRFFAKLRCSLMPYLFAATLTASQEGIPVMRAMMMEFPEDNACHYLDKQYMLGDSLLVAPIFNETGTAGYYLPAGEWTNFFTGETVAGNCWKSESHNYFSLPLMVRQNTLLALGNRSDRADYDYADHVILHLFSLQDNAIAKVTVYNTSRSAELDIVATKMKDKITIKVLLSKKPFSIILRGIGACTVIKGGESEATPLGMKILPSDSEKEIIIVIP